MNGADIQGSENTMFSMYRKGLSKCHMLYLHKKRNEIGEAWDSLA